MSIYFRLIIFYLLCMVSSSVCDICLTCSCSTIVNEGPVINCDGKHLGKNDSISLSIASDLLMLEEHQASNKLILSRNSISHLSGHLLKKLKSLKRLDLSDNLIDEIHTNTFVNLNNLEELNLSKNMLKTFDDELLAALPALRILDLSSNHISDIQHRINKARTNLTVLNLSNNSISNLPNMFFESLSSLQYLDLSFNKIHALEHDSFVHLISLKIFYINNNFLTSLDVQEFPESLIELHSGYNSIAELFPKPSKIKVLNIEYNKLSEIHSNLTTLMSLQHLNISGNMLSKFPHLLLQNLEVLDISSNNLSYIPETISTKNFPLLVQLNVSKNPIRNLTFHSDLKLHSFVASNISMLESIEKDTLRKLIAPLGDCINLTLSNNKILSVHEEALEHIKQNLCSLDLSNNKITYMSQNLIARNASSMIHSINLQGNPFRCNCALQWMLNDLVPKLYSTHPHLLNNLRCALPPQISNMRMAHWYGWKYQVFCTNVSDFNEELTMNVAGVSNNSKIITLDASSDVLIILGTAITVLTILIIVGFIWTQKLAMKRRRMNRKF